MHCPMLPLPAAPTTITTLPSNLFMKLSSWLC
jgi:hypothetical protein